MHVRYHLRPQSHALDSNEFGRVEWHMQEGHVFEPIKHVATVRGKARHILLGERVALNMLARCSGIATKCVFGLCQTLLVQDILTHAP